MLPNIQEHPVLTYVIAATGYKLKIKFPIEQKYNIVLPRNSSYNLQSLTLLFKCYINVSSRRTSPYRLNDLISVTRCVHIQVHVNCSVIWTWFTRIIFLKAALLTLWSTSGSEKIKHLSIIISLSSDAWDSQSLMKVKKGLQTLAERSQVKTCSSNGKTLEHSGNAEWNTFTPGWGVFFKKTK